VQLRITTDMMSPTRTSVIAIESHCVRGGRRMGKKNDAAVSEEARHDRVGQ